MNDTVKIPEAAALGVSVQLEFPGGTLVFQTHVAQEASPAELNAMTDKLVAVVERQRAKNTLVELKRNLEKDISDLEKLRGSRELMDAENMRAHAESGKRGEFKLSAQQSQQRAQTEINEKVYGQRIVDFKRQIAEAEGIIAGK